jgi:hypothetical protein
MNLAGHIGFIPELIRIQYAFLATAPCGPNIRCHEDIVILAIFACRFLRGPIRVRPPLAAFISLVRTPGTFASGHFIYRTQGWDAGSHDDDVRLDTERQESGFSLIILYKGWALETYLVQITRSAVASMYAVSAVDISLYARKNNVHVESAVLYKLGNCRHLTIAIAQALCGRLATFIRIIIPINLHGTQPQSRAQGQFFLNRHLKSEQYHSRVNRKI